MGVVGTASHTLLFGVSNEGENVTGAKLAEKLI